MKLSATATITMVVPGISETQGAEISTSRPLDAMMPQSAVGGCTPTPRKLSPAAKTTSAPSEVVP